MDNKSIEIFASAAYKALVEKEPFVTPELLETHVKMLIEVVNKLGGHVVPFQNKPAGSPRGTKVAGEPCPDCLTPFTAGAKGAYCKPCYIAWKNKK